MVLAVMYAGLKSINPLIEVNASERDSLSVISVEFGINPL